MARLARVLGISGAAVLLAVPFIASAQEQSVPVDGDVIAESEDDVVSSDVAADDGEPVVVDAPDVERRTVPVEPDAGSEPSIADDVDVERAGPPWYEGTFEDRGKPPWAGGREGRGKPSWAGRDDDDGVDRVGPPWYDGEEAWSPGDGKPPWAGGPEKAERPAG